MKTLTIDKKQGFLNPMRDILEDAEGAVERGDVGPGKANRENDAQKFPKRFYKTVSVEDHADGYIIALDGKPVKTPGRQPLALPGKASAKLVADEWDAVDKEINPLKMPCTRLANTAVDGVSTEMQAVMEDITRYAASDLLCYRADAPQGLVELQRQHWDPVLDWYQSELGAWFETGEGIVHVAQPREAITIYNTRLKTHQDAFKLACLHTFTSLTGSALLALALAEKHLTAEQVWQAAHVDENWNISQWGEDWEAEARRKQREADFHAADKLIKSL